MVLGVCLQFGRTIRRRASELVYRGVDSSGLAIGAGVNAVNSRVRSIVLGFSALPCESLLCARTLLCLNKTTYILNSGGGGAIGAASCTCQELRSVQYLLVSYWYVRGL